MGYWDSLTKYHQAMCRQMVAEIEQARPEESNGPHERAAEGGPLDR